MASHARGDVNLDDGRDGPVADSSSVRPTPKFLKAVY
jgi:hypothetical protein